jgi:hypothetical protein
MKRLRASILFLACLLTTAAAIAPFVSTARADDGTITTGGDRTLPTPTPAPLAQTGEVAAANPAPGAADAQPASDTISTAELILLRCASLMFAL